MKNLIFYTLLTTIITSCDDIVEVENISNETVILVAPSNETIVTTESINFTWEAIGEAESYHLQIATPVFNNATQVVEDTIVHNLNFSKLLDQGEYQWRVRAKNSAYTTNYSINSFNVDY